MKKLLIGLLALGSFSAYANCKVKINLKGMYQTGFYDACWGCGDGFEKRIKKKKNRMKNRMLRLITKSIKKQGYSVVSSNESADFDLNVTFSHSVWELSEYYINDESQHHADIELVNKLNGSISSLYARNIYYGRTTSNYSTFKTAVRKAFKSSTLPYCY